MSERNETQLDAVIAAHLRQQDSGLSDDTDTLIDSYPQFDGELRDYLAGEALIEQLLAPRRRETRKAHNEPTLQGNPLTADQSLPECRKVGRYVLLRELGRGAMGIVFLANDPTLRKLFAVKIPHHSASTTNESLSRLLREAQTAASLNHPGICRTYDVNIDADIPHITMEYIRGIPLADLVGTPPLSGVAAILRMIIAIAAAAEHAHVNGVIHRDLKPANILVDEELAPHVTDFGLARQICWTEESKQTLEGQVLGTPEYMAPEQLRGEQAAIGSRSDVYSLGVILFELLTTRLPFEGSTADIIAQVLTQPAIAPGTLRPDIPIEIDTLCLRMLEHEPTRRMASMHDVAHEAQRILDLRAGADHSASSPVGRSSDPALQERRERGFASALSLIRKWPVATVALGILLTCFLATIYLRNGRQILEIRIDDAIRDRGPIALTLDEDEYTLSGGDIKPITLSLGEHEYSVRHGDTVITDATRFELVKGGKTVLAIGRSSAVIVDPATNPDALVHSTQPGQSVSGSDVTPPPASSKPVFESDFTSEAENHPLLCRLGASTNSIQDGRYIIVCRDDESQGGGIEFFSQLTNFACEVRFSVTGDGFAAFDFRHMPSTSAQHTEAMTWAIEPDGRSRLFYRQLRLPNNEALGTHSIFDDERLPHFRAGFNTLRFEYRKHTLTLHVNGTLFRRMTFPAKTPPGSRGLSFWLVKHQAESSCRMELDSLRIRDFDLPSVVEGTMTH